jgi:hypothetical protein
MRISSGSSTRLSRGEICRYVIGGILFTFLKH